MSKIFFLFLGAFIGFLICKIRNYVKRKQYERYEKANQMAKQRQKHI